MSKKLSRDELLDEAIVKAKEAEDWQLAEWLRAARGSDDACRWFTAKINDLKTENEQLRELVVRMSRALDIDGDWCHRACHAEFRCSGSCAIADALVELGIAEYEEVDE